MEADNIIIPTYNNAVHSMFPFNIECTECLLGITRDRHNREIDEENRKGQKEYAIGMTGPEDLSKAKLLVVSDLNGHYEKLARHAMYDLIQEKGERKNGLLNNYNAGAYLRMMLSAMFNLDTYNEVLYTNAIKCNPGKEKPKDCYMKVCSRTWLSKEMAIVDEQIPNIPILVAGNVAFKAMCLVYNRPDIQSIGLNNCRRYSDITFNGHPVVFTENPAKGAGSMPRIESRVATVKGQIYIKNNRWLDSIPPLSACSVFRDDLTFLAEFLT